MKVSTKTAPEASIPKKTKSISFADAMVIPLKKEPIDSNNKEAMTFKLRSDPKNEKSITYSVSLAPFNTGSPEQWLVFMKTLKVIFKGQNLTNGPEQFTMTKRLLEGNALSVFENEVTTAGLTESTANLDKALAAITEDVFPSNALMLQKRQMRRFIKKPLNMKMTHFVARLNEMNEQLLQYPGATIEAKIPEDELKEIVEFAIPNEWKKQMKLQQFKVLDKTLNQLVEFCKHMEEFELLHPDKQSKKTKENKHDSNNPTKRKRASKSTSNEKFCMFHGPGHSSEECKKLINFVKQEKKTYLRKSKNTKNSKTFSREEVHAMLTECKRASTEKHASKRRKVDKQMSKTRQDFESFHIFSDSNEESDDSTKSTAVTSDSDETTNS